MAKQIIDGCTAAAHVAFALSEVATVYPITPVAGMGQTAQKWGLIEGRRNIFGQPLDVREMESELGAAGATHGALRGGALSTTFTASQGLLLMIPNMYKIAGEMLPAVFHVGTRSLASHALSIFGDHQDVMACRSTGFAMLASASVQETMDLAVVAHLAAIDGSLPVIHIMDGWRTSNEMSTIEMIDYDTIKSLVNMENVRRFRARAMDPSRPDLHGSSQNPGVFFQNREACNTTYARFPGIVQAAMDRLGKAVGRQYHLVDYFGAPDATDVIVIMGSGACVAREAADRLNAAGGKAGVLVIRLLLPFPAKAFADAIPATVKRVAVLNRTKEPGEQAEPLTFETITALYRAGRRDIRVCNGRYGLSSKDFTPSMANAVFGALADGSLGDDFTVGIDDDVTNLSVKVIEQIDTTSPDIYQAIFYGMGSDGTVGSTRLAANIIGNAEGLYAQAYFSYSAKKSGGYTISQLRFDNRPVTSSYDIEGANYIGCNKDTYVDRFDMLDKAADGAIFVLNSAWTRDQLETKLPARVKRAIARKRLRFYNIDAAAISQSVGLGVRINTVMATVFLKLCGVMPFDRAKERLQQQVRAAYAHEGSAEVDANLRAIDSAVASLRAVDYPESWADAADAPSGPMTESAFITEIARPCFDLKGNSLPVSLFAPDGRVPAGTTAWEKRSIALKVPQWIQSKCVQCTLCSLVCPHAAIRPFLITPREKASAPAGFDGVEAHGGPAFKDLTYRIQVFTRDCTGCGSCATICPGKALEMSDAAPQIAVQTPLEEYATAHVSYKEDIVSRFTINGSQFMQPLLEFSGACAGCGETPYVKLLTQLFGDRMLIANATGCSSIWGGSYPSNPYCANSRGEGPAWSNSLFEDNAEFGYGIAAATEQRRARVAGAVRAIAAKADGSLKAAAEGWLEVMDDPVKSRTAADALLAALEDSPLPEADIVRTEKTMLRPRSIWAIGGDGWAYDIGFAGLDHVLAAGHNINLFVLDTECYSNTGGQASKATPLAACAKYAPMGKRTPKKDLARMMMTYGNIYVATVALGANYQQCINAMREAEAFDGPSLIVAYCPCIDHGIKAGMSTTIVEEREAVKAGYWPLMRYNPDKAEPLSIDCPSPDGRLVSFINGENRYADLKMVSPDEASRLQPLLQKRLYSVYGHLAAARALAPVLPVGLRH